MSQHSAVDRLGTGDKPVFFRCPDESLPGLMPGDDGAVRLVTRSLGGMQKEALVASGATRRTWRLASDEGAYLAGHDAAPCPLSFFTVGWAGELHAAMVRLGGAAGISLPGLRLTLDSYYTMRGSALQGTMVGGARDARLTLQSTDGVPAGQLLRLAQECVRVSAMARIAREPLANRFSLACNDRFVPIAGLASGPDHPDLRADDAIFDPVKPATADRLLIVRGALTPRAPHTSTLAGGSLAPEQDRVLHVRGVTHLREDGLLQVEQLLFNPHGSRFTFLCDPLLGRVPAGEAPDPWSYAAAGVAFCFMTQFGRYARIMRLPLEDCRLVQLMRFRADLPASPIETAVRLKGTFTDDEGALQMQMAEKTCFLHALCRSSVKLRLAAPAWSAEPPEPTA